MRSVSVDDLLKTKPAVVNVGLESFARTLSGLGVPVAQVSWSPPAGGDAELANIVSLLNLPGEKTERIEAANREAVRRMLEGDPVLIDVVPAESVIPQLKERLILHAGPPIEWARMCGPMQGAVSGAILYEGWTKDLDAATALAASGGVQFQPNHHFSAVGPMTGMITRTMPVMVVENRKFGNRAYCTINEGLGKVMRFSARRCGIPAASPSKP